ncbi:MAG: hypothetical protein R3F11_33245 [Verrucomicrobiales bacterium]
MPPVASRRLIWALAFPENPPSNRREAAGRKPGFESNSKRAEALDLRLWRRCSPRPKPSPFALRADHSDHHDFPMEK